MPASASAQHGSVYLQNPYEDVSEGEDETSHTGALGGLANHFGNGTPVQRRSGYALRNLTAQHPFATPRMALGPPAAPAPRYHGHSASAVPPQPRLPDHVASFGTAAPAHADELTFNSTIKDRVTGPGVLKRAGSAEAESPPNARLYTARLRSAAPAAQPSDAGGWQGQQQRHHQHQLQQQLRGRAAVPTFQREASEAPPASGQGGSALAAPSVDAASEGPIKKRFKAAAKAAAAADAAAQEVDSARADSTTATGTNTACGSLLNAASRMAGLDRGHRSAANGAVGGPGFHEGEAAVMDCDSPCSAPKCDGPAAAAIARRKGMRPRPPEFGRRLQPPTSAGGPATPAAATELKPHPAGPGVSATTTPATTGGATATPFSLDASQAAASSVAQPGQDGRALFSQELSGGGLPSTTEPRRQLRSQAALC